MRVLFHEGASRWSGRTRAFTEAGRLLRDRGYQVTFACRTGSPVAATISDAGFEVVAVDETPIWGAPVRQFAAGLVEHFVEVIFVHSAEAHLFAAAAVRIAERGAVVRRIEAGTRFRLGPRALLARRLAASGVLFADPLSERDAPSRGFAFESGVAPLGVRVHDRMPRAPRDDRAPVRVACLMDGDNRPAVATVLRAFALLAARHPDVTLSLIGPGADHDDLRLHAAALGITTRVAYAASPRDHDAAVDAADIGWVVAQRDDAVFGCLDCMARGIPLLAERTPLLQRVIVDGETGHLVDADDMSGAAALLAALIASADRRTRMGDAGRVRAARDYPEQAMADGVQAVVERARDRSRWIT